MRDGTPVTGNGPATHEWQDFRAHLVEQRKRLERTLRRQLVHDPRAQFVRRHNVSAADLADEAICWAMDQWRAKPASTSPGTWLRKRALQLLDEALDRETLAAESRTEERAKESRLLAEDVLQDDEERARWVDVAELANPDLELSASPPEPFDGLASDPSVSSVEDRIAQTEVLVELEQALLRLPEVRRKVIALRYLDGLEEAEIAYLLDASLEEVLVELAAGLKALRLELAPR